VGFASLHPQIAQSPVKRWFRGVALWLDLQRDYQTVFGRLPCFASRFTMNLRGFR